MKIKVVCFTQTSGTLYVGSGDTEKKFILEPGRLQSGKPVGRFYIDESDKALIENSPGFKRTTLQFEDPEDLVHTAVEPSGAEPATAAPSGAAVIINPFDLTEDELQLVENAKTVNPELVSIIKENIMIVCNKVLNTDELTPKVVKNIEGEAGFSFDEIKAKMTELYSKAGYNGDVMEMEGVYFNSLRANALMELTKTANEVTAKSVDVSTDADTGTKTVIEDAANKMPETIPTLEELNALSMTALQEAFKVWGFEGGYKIQVKKTVNAENLLKLITEKFGQA